MLLSNESRVFHIRQQHGLRCIRIPDLLRIWLLEGIVTRQEIEGVMTDLQQKDRMRFKRSTLDKILSQP